MQDSNNLREELNKLLKQKKSKAFYAQRLGISIDEINDLMLNDTLKKFGITTIGNSMVEEGATIRQDINKGTIEVSTFYKTAPTVEQIIADHKIDLNEWKLSSFWSKQKHNGYYVSALFSKVNKVEDFGNKFTEFLASFKSTHKVISNKLTPKLGLKLVQNTALIVNKQDAHYNKFDVDGDNDIETRHTNIQYAIEQNLKKATLTSNLTKVYYIVGSDAFNSEFTGTTTKGTPQTNVDTYQNGFEDVCYNEVATINLILSYCKDVELVFISGNHDEYVGWHMVSWLKAYYREQKNLIIDDSPEYTKYKKFGTTAMQFNHGDAIKPEKLATMFPMEFKKEWSSCDNFYTFTGDKHHLLAKDFHGIQFYQLPSLSKAKSLWDKKNGHTGSKAELVSFLIKEQSGMSDIYREII